MNTPQTQEGGKAARTPLAKGNEALRQGDYAQAIAYYAQFIIQQPGLAQSISANLAIARQKYRASRQDIEKPSVGVCGWELAHNAAGRAYTLATLYETFAQVEIIGSLFPSFGREIWEPIRDTPIAKHTFIVEDESRFLEQAIQLVAAYPYDIVHLSKPRAPNIFFGVLYKLLWDPKVLMDIDDEELACVGEETPISIDEYIQQHGKLPELKNLAGKDWTRLAVGLAKEFDGVTVCNAALQERYDGEIIRHARDEKLFNPSPELKRKSREKYGISQDSKVVLFFGTPREHKGLIETAQAIAALQRLDVVFCIVGTFSDETLKQRLIEVEGCNYKFLPNQPISRTQEILAIADCCVLLQVHNSTAAQYQTPAKLSDAMAMGIPVAMSPTPAVAEVIAAGAVVSVDKTEAKPQLDQLLRDNFGRINNIGLKFFSEYLSCGIVAERLHKLTNSLAPQVLSPKRISIVETTRGSTCLLSANLLSLLLPTKRLGDALDAPLQDSAIAKQKTNNSQPKVSSGVGQAISDDHQHTATYFMRACTDKFRVAVVAHFYYSDIWREIAVYLKAIHYSFDLFVTAPINVAAEAIAEISLEFPNVRFSFGPNRGMDIVPFLALIPILVNEGYSAVCKIQTKRGGDDLAPVWRKVMLQTLIGSQHNFEVVANAFKSDQDLVMAGPAITFQSGPLLMFENTENVEQISQSLFQKSLPNSEWGFFAGTMFWLRPELVIPLASFVTFNHEKIGSDYRRDGNFEHSLERVFGLIPFMGNKKIGLLHQCGLDVARCTLISQQAVGHRGINRSGMGDAMRQILRLTSDFTTIQGSNLFNHIRYLHQCQELVKTDVDLIVHYLTQGRFSNRSPDGYFSPIDYLQANGDVTKAKLEPFVHFIKHGAKEGRSLSKNAQKDQEVRPHLRFAVLNKTMIDWVQQNNKDRTPGLVSIVIPVYNQPELTTSCIESVLSVECSSPFEIIVVDNGSEKKTKEVLKNYQKSHSKILVITNQENMNFALGCNLGAQAANGEFIVFLNNDTTVTDHWIDEMAKSLEDPNAVAVQPKLLFPDNSIQCAGIVFSKWSSLGYPLYAGFPPETPCVNRPRRLKAVTAACIAIRATNFAAVDGFNPVFINGQEDVDLCLRLTNKYRGYCIYQPNSLVFHHEGKSHGRGKFIHWNRRVFLDLWRDQNLEDDIVHYQEDGFYVTEWEIDSENSLNAGLGIFRPKLTAVGAKKPHNMQQCELFMRRHGCKYDQCEAGYLSENLNKGTILVCAHASGKHLFGGERSFLDMLDAIVRLDLNIIVTVPGFINSDYIELIRQRTVAVYGFDYEHWTERKKISRPAVERFKSIMEFHRVCILHANTIMLREPFIAAMELNILSFMHVRELISSDEYLVNYIGLPSVKILDVIRQRSDSLIANSAATAKELGKNERVFIARNVVQVEDLDLENTVDKSRIVFGMISSNIPKKGIFEFVEIALRCTKFAPNAIFALIGPTEGPDHADIASIIDRKRKGGLPSNLIFPGYKETTREAISETNVVLNLSLVAESFGRSVGEAMAARRPVIAYDWGALNELVNDGITGYLVPYMDVDAIARRVVELANDPAKILEMGEAARRAVVQQCSPQSLVNSLDAAYAKGYVQRADRHIIDGEGGIHNTIFNAAGRQFKLHAHHAFGRVTVIIPVFNAIEEVIRCVESVIRHTDLFINDVILINDGSTDQAVAERLQLYADLRAIRVVENSVNLGYTKTVNKGIELAGDRDVILLNSDTEVTPGWLFGLRLAAYSRGDIGTVTAMGNNAGVFSFPKSSVENLPPDGFDRVRYSREIISSCCNLKPLELPTGNGFCMYIRRDLINKVGVFDVNAFPRGYGEENDFCMRGMKAGFKNLLSPWVYIYHARNASFGSEKEKLVKEGEKVLHSLHPEYARLVSAAFSGEAFQQYRNATAMAL